MRNKALCILFCALVLIVVSPVSAFAESAEQGVAQSPVSEKTMAVLQYVGLKVNGSPLKSDAQPFINGDNRTVLPLRAIAEAFGATVNWDDAAQTASITLGNRALKVKIGDRSLLANGQAMAMDTSAFVKDNRTFVPARAIAEGLGLTVTWDPNTVTVTVTTALPTTPPVPPAPQVKFPLTAYELKDKIGLVRDFHMETNLTLFENGTLTGTTHTWTTNEMFGFTGGVVATVLNKDDIVIWRTQQDHRFEVQGTLMAGMPFIRAESDRVDTWSEKVPSETMKDAAKISISQKEVAPPVKFPLTAYERNDKIENDDGEHMETNLSLSEDGTLTGKTRTWTANKTYGFTGGVVAAVVNKDDIVIWQTQQDHQYGVDGTLIPFTDSDRVDTWTEQVPSEIVKSAVKIVVHNQHQGKNRLVDIGNTILKNNPLSTAAEWISYLLSGR